MKCKITNYKVFALNTHWTLFLLCSALLAFPVLGLPCMISMALNIRHNYTQLIFVSACCIAASTVLGTLFLHFQKKLYMTGTSVSETVSCALYFSVPIKIRKLRLRLGILSYLSRPYRMFKKIF